MSSEMNSVNTEIPPADLHIVKSALDFVYKWKIKSGFLFMAPAFESERRSQQPSQIQESYQAQSEVLGSLRAMEKSTPAEVADKWLQLGGTFNRMRKTDARSSRVTLLDSLNGSKIKGSATVVVDVHKAGRPKYDAANVTSRLETLFKTQTPKIYIRAYTHQLEVYFLDIPVLHELKEYRLLPKLPLTPQYAQALDTEAKSIVHRYGPVILDMDNVNHQKLLGLIFCQRNRRAELRNLLLPVFHGRLDPGVSVLMELPMGEAEKAARTGLDNSAAYAKTLFTGSQGLQPKQLARYTQPINTDPSRYALTASGAAMTQEGYRFPPAVNTQGPVPDPTVYLQVQSQGQQSGTTASEVQPLPKSLAQGRLRANIRYPSSAQAGNQAQDRSNISQSQAQAQTQPQLHPQGHAPAQVQIEAQTSAKTYTETQAQAPSQARSQAQMRAQALAQTVYLRAQVAQIQMQRSHSYGHQTLASRPANRSGGHCQAQAQQRSYSTPHPIGGSSGNSPFGPQLPQPPTRPQSHTRMSITPAQLQSQVPPGHSLLPVGAQNTGQQVAILVGARREVPPVQPWESPSVLRVDKQVPGTQTGYYTKWQPESDTRQLSLDNTAIPDHAKVPVTDAKNDEEDADADEMLQDFI